MALTPAVRDGHSLLTAEVSPESADEVLDFMHDRGVMPEDVALARVEEIGRPARAHAGAGLIWADMLGKASRNARPVARYLVLMVVAGVIAAYGVIEVNSILIVGRDGGEPRHTAGRGCLRGARERRRRLAWRALVTLVIGLGATCAAAAALTAAPRPVRHSLIPVQARTTPASRA